MKFHHIGIATKDLNKSISIYRKMGYVPSELIYDPNQKVNLCFLKKTNSPLIELVGSNEKQSILANIVKKNGTTPYHTCYEVNNLQKKIDSLLNLGFIMLVKPVEAIAFDNRKISFLYSINFGIIELLEC
jgi:methylmalonyl-CoA/ethylmalonyl-CoA epimerase